MLVISFSDSVVSSLRNLSPNASISCHSSSQYGVFTTCASTHAPTNSGHTLSISCDTLIIMEPGNFKCVYCKRFQPQNNEVEIFCCYVCQRLTRPEGRRCRWNHLYCSQPSRWSEEGRDCGSVLLGPVRGSNTSDGKLCRGHSSVSRGRHQPCIV